jgi:hypothetical protein
MGDRRQFPVASLNARWEHRLVRRCSLYLRLIALTLAVGLGALLVGLSVAPNALPGNTVRIQPRDLSGALLRVALPASRPGVTRADVPTRTQPPWLPSLAVFLLALSLGAVALRPAAPTPVQRAALTDVTRGPPTGR